MTDPHLRLGRLLAGLSAAVPPAIYPALPKTRLDVAVRPLTPDERRVIAAEMETVRAARTFDVAILDARARAVTPPERRGGWFLPLAVGLAVGLAAGMALAAGDVPDWAVEGPYEPTVIEAAVEGPLWPKPDDARSWAILTAWFGGPDAEVAVAPPVPVPLPPAGWALAAALAGLAALRKGRAG